LVGGQCSGSSELQQLQLSIQLLVKHVVLIDALRLLKDVLHKVRVALLCSQLAGDKKDRREFEKFANKNNEISVTDEFPQAA
jgi:hypothetical protein